MNDKELSIYDIIFIDLLSMAIFMINYTAYIAYLVGKVMYG